MQLCRELSYEVPVAEAAVVFKRLDYNDDGSIDCDEFSTWWQSEDKFAQCTPGVARQQQNFTI